MQHVRAEQQKCVSFPHTGGNMTQEKLDSNVSTSWPAQAIMAPLSVHSAGGGTTSRSPASAVTACVMQGQMRSTNHILD
jgi:hypothetical protein